MTNQTSLPDESDTLPRGATGGILLLVAASLALVIANSRFASGYYSLLELKLGPLSLLHWINDGLMSIFFLYVGLEIKREIIAGQLSTLSQRVLPGVAALGGMVGPALIYLAFNADHSGNVRGWAIASATDIAFALSIFSVFGSWLPNSLRLFLTALAIIDDLGAVLIIATFYTVSIDILALSGAFAVLLLLIAMNSLKVGRVFPYLLCGLVLWVFVLRSGVHATIAAVLLAFTIPMRATNEGNLNQESALLKLEHNLSPWITCLVLPVFGFANAGLSFQHISIRVLTEPLALGIILGLFFGKQAGVFAGSFLAIKAGWAKLPSGTNWRMLYGTSILCGIGFTMSIFIGLLAFNNAPGVQEQAKASIIVGSILSAIGGGIVLSYSHGVFGKLFQWLWRGAILAPLIALGMILLGYLIGPIFL